MKMTKEFGFTDIDKLTKRGTKGISKETLEEVESVQRDREKETEADLEGMEKIEKGLYKEEVFNDGNRKVVVTLKTKEFEEESLKELEKLTEEYENIPKETIKERVNRLQGTEETDNKEEVLQDSGDNGNIKDLKEKLDICEIGLYKEQKRTEELLEILKESGKIKKEMVRKLKVLKDENNNYKEMLKLTSKNTDTYQEIVIELMDKLQVTNSNDIIKKIVEMHETEEELIIAYSEEVKWYRSVISKLASK